MFMGQQHAADLFRIELEGFKPAQQFPARKTRIHQHSFLPGGNDQGVPFAAAPEYSYFQHDRKLFQKNTDFSILPLEKSYF